MLSEIQPPLPLLDQVRHRHLCEAFEGSPRHTWTVSTCARSACVG